MAFTVTQYQDVFTLTNTDATFSLTYKLELLNGCYNYTETIAETTLATGESYEFTSLADGEYKLTIVQDAVTTEVTLKNYLELQTSLINDVYLVLCDCSCSCDSCSSDCGNNCNNNLTTVLKLLSFISLTYPIYNLSLEKVSEEIKCLLGEDISCLLINEKITGSSENGKLLKKVIALYYLALYFMEYTIMADDTAEETYVNMKFKFDTISVCISKLGIDISDVEQTIINNMGNFEITSAAYVNQPPDTVGDYALGVANRATTTLTFAMFTSSTTPPYSDPEGDPADAVRFDSIPADGTLKVSGIAATPGQIVLEAVFTANDVTYESPDQDALDVDTFTFSVRDSGSGQWSS